MSKEKCTLTHLEAAAKQAKRAYHKHGPKSYRKGQGALLKVLHKEGGTATRDQLIERLGFSRRELKDAVRKAERNGYITLQSIEGQGYTATITPEGDTLAEKRCAAQAKVAKEILGNLTDEEVAQLDALLLKIVGEDGKHDGMHRKHCRKKSGKRNYRR
ncbi:MAG: MarR family transcriptional regulator [Eggerthellaceae bacterium]|nr:MarR family transcriptional regulator [Eggerthellaceae bacterium]